MNARTIIAGIISVLACLANLLSVIVVYFIILFVSPRLADYLYFWIWPLGGFVFSILFGILAFGLFLRKKWSFKLGIVLPVIGIVYMFSEILLLSMFPNLIAPSTKIGFENMFTFAIRVVIQLVLLFLVYTGRKELVN